MNTFTLVFLIALLLTLLVKSGLIVRQMRHVWLHREQVPAAFVGKIGAVEHLRAAQYALARGKLALWGVVQESLILVLFTLGGGLDWLAGWWFGMASPLLADAGLIISVMLLSALLELPVDWYRKFVVEQRFGFNAMKPADFLRDLLLQVVLGVVLGVPLLMAVLWIMRRAGTDWWLYAWLVWVAFNVLVLAIYPTFIAPLFNKFAPLEDVALKQRIEHLLHKSGFAAQGLYVMDGSKRSSHGNAYFTGFGRSRRIVLFDTLLKQLQPDEIVAVLAHELGHFHHRHVLKRMAWMFGLSLLALWLAAQAIDSAWFYAALRVSHRSSGMGLLLFFLVMPVFSLPLQWWSAASSRRNEFEADRYAAQQTNPALLVNALVGLYRDNAATLTSDAWYSSLNDSHPNAQQRVAHLLALLP